MTKSEKQKAYDRKYYQDHKEQEKARTKKYREAHPEHYPNYYRRTRWGILPEEWQEMIRFGCFACGSTAKLRIDHDHSHCPGMYGCKDCIRGVLCDYCNRGLGFLRDDLERLKRLVEYLEKYGRTDKDWTNK